MKNFAFIITNIFKKRLHAYTISFIYMLLHGDVVELSRFFAHSITR